MVEVEFAGTDQENSSGRASSTRFLLPLLLLSRSYAVNTNPPRKKYDGQTAKKKGSFLLNRAANCLETKEV